VTLGIVAITPGALTEIFPENNLMKNGLVSAALYFGSSVIKTE
jgi:hypothetical protein